MVGPIPLYTTSLQRNTSRLRSNSEVATSEDTWLIRHAGHNVKLGMSLTGFEVTRARCRPTSPFDGHSYLFALLRTSGERRTLFMPKE